MKLQITFLDRASFEYSINIKPPLSPHKWAEYDFTKPEEIVERAKNSEILLVNKVKINAKTIDQLTKLKLISITATGTDIIDLDHCRKKKILVTNVNNYGTSSIAEHTLLLILALKRKLLAYHNAIIDNKWNNSKNFCYYDLSLSQPIKELKSSRLGILGAGTIGLEVGRIGKALGMDVVYYNRSKLPDKYKSISFNQLLSSSDVISIHLPLNKDTKGMISIKEINKMKSSAILINTARGGIVVENDLVIALKDKKIAGIGFDVLSNEPPTSGNPLLLLADRPDVIITPHIAWAGKHSAENLINLAIANIEKYLKGEKLISLT